MCITQGEQIFTVILNVLDPIEWPKVDISEVIGISILQL
jgi:hypothetical protein